MVRIGLLTCSDYPELTASDQKIALHLDDCHFNIRPIIWDSPTFCADDFDVLIFRSTWDYHLKKEKFFHFLQALQSTSARIFNPIDVILWNIHKFYLQDLKNVGINIVPSIFISKENKIEFEHVLPQDWDRIVIKPAVSAGSYLTELFDWNQVASISQKYKEIRKTHDLIIQKYIPEITENGELSLVYFDKKFSHGVIKTPRKGDFRIQSEFGGTYTPFMPDRDLIETCDQIIQYVHQDLMYARIDGILIDEVFHLMELELIEPDLYMDYISEGHNRFGQTIVKYLKD